MVSEEEVKQGLIHVENVGPPLAEDEHLGSAESLPDPDLVEDLIQDESVEPPATFGDGNPKVRPLDQEFFASVRSYVNRLPDCRVDKLLPGVLADNLRDQEFLNRLFCGKKQCEDALPRILGYNLFESSLTVSNGNGKPHKIFFHPVRRNNSFFLRLSDPGSYEHKKSLFLWRMVSSIRLKILNPSRLRLVLEEVKTYAVKPENERITKLFAGKLEQAAEQEKDLRAFTETVKWTRHFLASTKESNSLAEKIWHALRAVPEGLVEDVLEELRTRFKRGRIWENDPWWPNDR